VKFRAGDFQNHDTGGVTWCTTGRPLPDPNLAENIPSSPYTAAQFLQGPQVRLLVCCSQPLAELLTDSIRRAGYSTTVVRSRAGAVRHRPVFGPQSAITEPMVCMTLCRRGVGSKFQFRATVGGLAGLRDTRCGLNCGSHRSSFRLTARENLDSISGWQASVPRLRRLSAGLKAFAFR
jgi:hypothetical protein